MMLERKVLEVLSPIVSGLLNDANSTQWEDRSGWGRTAWEFFTTATNPEPLLNIVKDAMVSGAKQIICQHTVTISDLANRLPQWKKSSILGSCRVPVLGIYLLLGQHPEPKYVMYVGSTKSFHTRFKCHKISIENAKKGLFPRPTLAVHRILAQDGWTTTYHALATLPSRSTSATAHLLFLETVFILLMKSCSVNKSPRTISNVERILRLEPQGWIYESPSASVDSEEAAQSPQLAHILRMNKVLPIASSFVDRSTKPRVCYHCQEDRTTVQYSRLSDGRAMCSNCKDYMQKNSDQMRPLELKAWRDELLSISFVDHCESCGISRTKAVLTRHLELRMMLCDRERMYYYRHGTLSPQRAERHVRCESCGISRTKSRLSRHTKLGIVLCDRERSYYARHGTLNAAIYLP